MNTELVLYEKTDGVAKLTLNRPDVLNSFNQAMARRMQELLREAGADTAVRAVLLTGAGRAFCAGQDLAEAMPHAGAPPADVQQFVRDNYNPIILGIRTIEKPFICAVNGVAAGAGANIALACDIVLASREATFIQAFCKIGLVPDSGGTFFLPRLAGLGRANAMMMLGEKISAQQALDFGLIYKVVDGDDLGGESLALAKQMAQMPTRGLGLIKRAVNASLGNDLQAQLRVEEELQGLAAGTEDFSEGVDAFLNKRKPVFKGS